MSFSKQLGALALGAALAFGAAAQVPAGYPADYAKIVDEAKKEGAVVVLGTTDAKEAAPLIKDFGALYPGIKVEYGKLNSTELFNRANERKWQGAAPDVLWSSAMDLQVKLASDGHALPYKSAEAAALPAWAVMGDVAYGTTFEPAVMVYNKRLLPAAEAPATRAELTALLAAKADKFKGKVITYDVEKSGLGFLLLTQDVREDAKFWDMVKAFGAAGVETNSSTDPMLDRVVAGQDLIAYNVLGSYALARAKKDPALGIAFFKDYMVVLSRVMFIAKEARHPNAARLWVDYVLSKRGQALIANEAQMYSVRPDVGGETTAAGLAKQYGSVLKPIALNSMLLRYLNQERKQALLKEWKASAGRK